MVPPLGGNSGSDMRGRPFERSLSYVAVGSPTPNVSTSDGNATASFQRGRGEVDLVWWRPTVSVNNDLRPTSIEGM
jgi:hypothetical protein